MQQNQNKPAPGDRTHRERHGAQGAKQMQTNTTNLDPGPTRSTGTAMLMGILAALLVLPVVAAEQDDEAVEFEWTRAMLDIIEAGDAERGAELAQKSKCSKCHGDAGIAEDDETPSIAGQVPAYHFKQLLQYKTKERDSRDMYKKVRRMELADFADLAAYYATLDPEPPADPGEPPLLVTRGDRDRLLLPCQVCHGENGEGMGMQVPALAGQKIDHFVETMIAFRDGDRENDDFGLMRFIAGQLSEDEITAVAAHYAAERMPEDEDEDD
jgi:cytochrome c553